MHEKDLKNMSASFFQNVREKFFLLVIKMFFLVNRRFYIYREINSVSYYLKRTIQKESFLSVTVI